MINYKTAREDFEFLESIMELEDHAALDERRVELMENPTKKVAGRIYEASCCLWFAEHGILEGTQDIAIRHGVVEALDETVWKAALHTLRPQ